MAPLSSRPCLTSSSSSKLVVPNLNLPAGFRFHPTDEELIVHYLMNQAASIPCPVPIVAEVNIYQCNPWDLPGKALFGESEWYFFSPRDRKYPNGARPNRAAGSGYWKATGTDKAILSARTGRHVGVKKALVFYGGRPPRGVKTDWIMHEYRLAAAPDGKSPTAANKRRAGGSMRLDDWVLCRIHKKSNDFLQLSSSEQEQESSLTVEQGSPIPGPDVKHEHDQFQQFHHPNPTTRMSKTWSITDLVNSIDYSAISEILDDDEFALPPPPPLNPPPIYPATTTTETSHPLKYNNNNSNNHLILPRVHSDAAAAYVVNNCNNGVNKRKRDDDSVEFFNDGSSGFGTKLKVLPASHSTNSSSHFGSTSSSSYSNQKQVVDTSGSLFQSYSSSSSLLMSYPFQKMQ